MRKMLKKTKYLVHTSLVLLYHDPFQHLSYSSFCHHVFWSPSLTMKEKRIIKVFVLCLEYLYKLNKYKQLHVTTEQPTLKLNLYLGNVRLNLTITGNSTTVEILSMSETQTNKFFEILKLHITFWNVFPFKLQLMTKHLILTVKANIVSVSICKIHFHNVRIINNLSKEEKIGLTLFEQPFIHFFHILCSCFSNLCCSFGRSDLKRCRSFFPSSSLSLSFFSSFLLVSVVGSFFSSAVMKHNVSS